MLGFMHLKARPLARAACGWLLSALLLITQQAALLHAMGHVLASGGEPAAAYAGDVSARAASAKTAAAHADEHLACKICLAYAVIGAALAAAWLGWQAQALLPLRRPTALRSYATRFRAAYRSRAPPALPSLSCI